MPAGTVALTVSGVLIEVPIPAGQTAAQVAQALADAVNADPSLQAARIFGIRTGDFFVTTGTVDGIQLPTAAVPAASPPTLMLLAALIAGLGLRRLRGRRTG